MNSLFENPTADQINIYGKILRIIDAALHYPTKSSSNLDMYKVEVPTNKNREDSIKCVSSDVKCKMVLLKIFELPNDEQDCYVVPLLHTM